MPRVKTPSWIVNIFQNKSVRIYLWCVGVVALWRFLLEFINHSFVKLGSTTTKPIPEISFGLDRWTAWDGNWYNSIIRDGYFLDYSRDTASNIPFFPGFPILTEALARATHIHPIYIGLALNVLLTTFCVYFIFQITALLARQMGENKRVIDVAPRLAVVLFLTFPSSLFLAAFYAEALLIFGISGAIYFALRNRLIVAAVFAGIACSTKSIGVAVLPAILIIHYQQHARRLVDWQVLKNNIGLYTITSMVGLSGILAYMLYLYIGFGDPLLFSSLQKLWLREFRIDFLVPLWEIYYRNTFVPSYYEGTFNYLITLIAMYGPIFAIIASFIFAKKYRLYWLVPLVLITILPPASTVILQSMNRYIFVFVPLFALFAIILARQRHNLLTYGIVACMSIVLVYATAGFLLGNHFAG